MLSITRRHLIASAIAGPVLAQRRPQRAVVFLIDGLGVDYWRASPLTNLHRWERSDVFKRVGDVMPSVTNVNSASICCSCWPDQHGITGNSYLNEKTGKQEYMESADLVLAPTLFERAAAHGVQSALLSAKHKTTTLLNRGAGIVISAEQPSAELVQRLGPAPGIYSAEINFWLLEAGLDILRSQRHVGCLFVHTTDYPMHTWAPEAKESKNHLRQLDALIGEAAAAASDAMILITADHGMNPKSACWDLERACASRGVPIRMSISVERDRYVQHHRGFGGTAWVYLKTPADENRAVEVISKLPGVERVYPRHQAATHFRLLESRVGDLMVLGNKDTVFGSMDQEFLRLPAGYRAHGSSHEAEVPVLLHNANAAPQPEYFQTNVDIARWLYR